MNVPLRINVLEALTSLPKNGAKVTSASRLVAQASGVELWLRGPPGAKPERVYVVDGEECPLEQIDSDRYGALLEAVVMRAFGVDPAGRGRVLGGGWEIKRKGAA